MDDEEKTKEERKEEQMGKVRECVELMVENITFLTCAATLQNQ